MDRGRTHPTRVAGERVNYLERRQAPDTDGLILSSGNKVSAVRRKGDTPYPALMAFTPGHFLAGGRVVEVKSLLAAAGQCLAIR
jgi:hypothetical protein